MSLELIRPLSRYHRDPTLTMAPRLNKRQQRELEEQEQLERLRDAHNEQGEAAGDESDEAPGPVASVFATVRHCMSVIPARS